MDLLGDQMWNEMTEEWAEYMYGEGNMNVDVRACCVTDMAGVDEDLQSKPFCPKKPTEFCFCLCTVIELIVVHR